MLKGPVRNMHLRGQKHDNAFKVFSNLEREFEAITKLSPKYEKDFHDEALALAEYLSHHTFLPFEQRRIRFLAHVNWKFRVNSEGLNRFYGIGARNGYTFNYHEKNEIQLAFDSSSIDCLKKVLERSVVDPKVRLLLLNAFDPVSESTTIQVLHSECEDPSRLRRPKGNRDIATEILQAQFAAFLFCALKPKEMHRYFDSFHNDETYCDSFWQELHTRSPHLFNRDYALYIARIDDTIFPASSDYIQARNILCAWIHEAYAELNNYSYLALLIEPIYVDGRAIQWELAADVTLYGEKHQETRLKKSYFRWKDIARETKKHIKDLDLESAEFQLVNEGFTYKDCFVIAPAPSSKHNESSLLLIFQKNSRDETEIPCPMCRSYKVQGNSYSSLGVRSWECNNLLCPDRSKYNRGKRYSFKGLLMQQAIDDLRNQVPTESVSGWLRDVQINRKPSEILDMLLRHYSLYDDCVHVFNWSTKINDSISRRLIYHKRIKPKDINSVSQFYNGPFFKRYIVEQTTVEQKELIQFGDENFKVICGDAVASLKTFPPSSFDGAVTSPPYYNARSYSQWENIYCYLNSMYNVANEVFRCLKPNSIYLYNIFDYFDNERSIVFSAMGQKRMILSAYTVDMFRRIGFECLGNIAWDKGDIEGKRGFNAGNFSPYYQAPFNCWEHILIFKKPGFDKPQSYSFPAVLKAQPVIKIVNGKNTHGHTAPFPDKIPELLTTQVQVSARILDPFGGSLTTGRVAERYGLKSVCIEQHEEYCDLGLKMRKEEQLLRKIGGKQLELWG